MQIRVISDLHIDINSNIPLEYNKDDGIFTVIAGDISGKAEWTERWLGNNIGSGLFIEGNHIGYSDERTIQELNTRYSIKYPIDSNVSYIHNAYKEVDGVLFVGATLWTDFKYKTDHDPSMVEENKSIARMYMNDYRLNHVYGADGEYRNLDPDDVEKFNKESFGIIKKTVEANSWKKIVVVTHHAPSRMSISPRYGDEKTNPCYVNELEQFILDHPQIKLWIHGHMHDSFDYMIGTTRVLCNPRGYEELGDGNKTFDKDLIVEV